MMRYFYIMVAVMAVMLPFGVTAQESLPATYCNPVNLDYTYMIYNSHKDISYRSGADPAVVEFRGEYYMFVTRSMGYWHSTDLQNWDFIEPQRWYFQGSNAPAAFNYKDSVLYVAGNPSGSMSILYTDDPKKGDWKGAPSIIHNIQDPALFIDDDGEAYMYWGSSNKFPIRARKMNKNKRFVAEDKKYELFNLDEAAHGWERFGENNFHPTLKEGYIEGPWMTKHDGKYYLQYAAPGTQFNVYGDGVYIADHPLGPYKYMPNNPMCFKPGGFMNGAGHGSTMEDTSGQFWHFASMALASNAHWERRICMFPTHFDKDGLMYSNTHYGDYPRFAATEEGKKGEPTGWMLLSYNKPTTISSVYLQERRSTSTDGHYDTEEIPTVRNKKGEIETTVLTDENTKSFWVAEANDDSQWVKIDLQKPSNIYALQVNYHDHKSDIYGRKPDMYHRYKVEVSKDGKKWETVIDKSNNDKDVPNDYVQLKTPVKARYVRYNHIHAPTPYFALSEIRIFGLGEGAKPKMVKNLKINREEDRREAQFNWDAVKGAQGYNIYWGIAPDKLYNSWLVYDKNELKIPSFDRDTPYYISIEAFNENGISERTEPVLMK
ncbi:family 43 glycosylhydrolase [Limibacter armeniacum]|uniref:family 43 glycosylhydrolase n=1 Tax=Limibacter armeniacum TaxID=466084 RepID=UPI002FE6050F